MIINCSMQGRANQAAQQKASGLAHLPEEVLTKGMEELHYEILSGFAEIPDPRVEPTKAHSLSTLLFIALCAFLTGCKSFYEMELFAEAHKTWLKKVAGMVSAPSTIG